MQHSICAIPFWGGSWFTIVLPKRLCSWLHFPKICEEGSYPTEIIYSRADLNGSRCVESFVCKDRADLICSLNWIGKCCFHLDQIWDYDDSIQKSAILRHIFMSAARRRYRQMQKALRDFEASIPAEWWEVDTSEILRAVNTKQSNDDLPF